MNSIAARLYTACFNKKSITLRRYSPSLIVVRRGLEDIELKNIQIPEGTNIEIPIPILQQLPDALDFNPKRFEHGVLGPCKFPQAYMPFGVGARNICWTTLSHDRIEGDSLLFYPSFASHSPLHTSTARL
ncbi:unnamed protein product [Prunus armeniaca]|uniref:Uncharacterized protein n=1 Tax=Prunus armeniaca TaxID=36596 RepID=A0A6J5WEP4_PRUAR|nr:unnamed protein product [Prunus armeniaca]